LIPTSFGRSSNSWTLSTSISRATRNCPSSHWRVSSIYADVPRTSTQRATSRSVSSPSTWRSKSRCASPRTLSSLPAHPSSPADCAVPQRLRAPALLGGAGGHRRRVVRRRAREHLPLPAAGGLAPDVPRVHGAGALGAREDVRDPRVPDARAGRAPLPVPAPRGRPRGDRRGAVPRDPDGAYPSPSPSFSSSKVRLLTDRFLLCALF
jgi:hypothetical protein